MIPHDRTFEFADQIGTRQGWIMFGDGAAVRSIRVDMNTASRAEARLSLPFPSHKNIRHREAQPSTLLRLRAVVGNGQKAGLGANNDL